MNGLRHVCLVLCAIVCYLAIYLSQLHFFPSTGTKVERNWKYNPRHSLMKTTIEPLKTPDQLQAKNQFSLSTHEAIWLGNKPVSSSRLFNSQQKPNQRNHTDHRLDAETQIEHMLWFCALWSHLEQPEVHSRGWRWLRNHTRFPLESPGQPHQRLVIGRAQLHLLCLHSGPQTLRPGSS